MKTWTIVGLFDLVFFPFCILVSANSKLDNLIENSKKKAPEALVCHVCHSENRQERECLNFTQFGDEFNGFPEQCDMEATSCMVRKFAFTLTNETTTLPMKTIAVKRNCTKTCEPGCIIMGERTRLYICNTCCKTPLCNVGSGTDSTIYNNNNKCFCLNKWHTYILFLLFWMIYETRRIDDVHHHH